MRGARPLSRWSCGRTGELTTWPTGFFDQAQIDLAALGLSVGGDDGNRDRAFRTRRIVVGRSDRGPAWSGALADAIERLLERLDAARARDEPVVKHENYYYTDLGDGVRLDATLFDPHCPVRLDRDLTNRLITALDRANAFIRFPAAPRDC